LKYKNMQHARPAIKPLGWTNLRGASVCPCALRYAHKVKL